jgi:hypothetical protein
MPIAMFFRESTTNQRLGSPNILATSFEPEATTWGRGVLHFQGKDYRLTMDAVGIMDVDGSYGSGQGKVYNLEKKIRTFSAPTSRCEPA